MVITKVPLRIPLCRGGCDLPSYYEKHGCMFVSGAINKYIYITLHHSQFNPNIRARYSRMEEVEDVNDLRNEILRETLKYHGIKNSIEITSHAEIPSGTGLGSSGSFGVGISHALNPEADSLTLANEATSIQMNKLGFPIGLQDQFVAAYGGVNSYSTKNGDMEIDMLNFDRELFESRLVLLFTGYNRVANKILGVQKIQTEAKNKDMLETLNKTQELAYIMREFLKRDDFDMFAKLMNEHWEEKKKRSVGMTTKKIDALYKKGLKNGAIGGKLVGAGGGGFMLFYTHDSQKLIHAMHLKHIPFKFMDKGSEVIIND